LLINMVDIKTNYLYHVESGLGKAIFKKLKVFSGPIHDHDSQQPKEWNPII